MKKLLFTTLAIIVLMFTAQVLGASDKGSDNALPSSASVNNIELWTGSGGPQAYAERPVETDVYITFSYFAGSLGVPAAWRSGSITIKKGETYGAIYENGGVFDYRNISWDPREGYYVSVY